MTRAETFDCPVQVPLAVRPMGVWDSLQTSRRNVLELIPEIAVRQPMVSGRTVKRWHMVMEPGAIRRVLKDRPAVCHITGFGDSSVDYILRFWIRDPVEGLTNVKGNVYLALWDTFHANGISIPFPQREVKVLPGSELAMSGQSAEGMASSKSPG